jgi:chemotaxis protein methyltransferase CheR
MTLSTKDFQRLSSFIYNELGIKMPDSKRTMLTGRLAKRLRVNELDSFSDYCDFVFSSEGQERELVHLLDVVTTNKTDFFREPAHYDQLVQTVLPTLIRENGLGNGRKCRIWSAGCSTGEEPYTLSMVLSEFAAVQASGFPFEILATDISTRVLEAARLGVYPENRIAPIAQGLRRKYLLRGKDRNNPEVRIVPELRSTVKFGRLNFMDREFGLRDPVDIIFCRNVIIYFDKPTQEQLMGKFCRHLRPGGFLFVGHSESLQGYDVPLVQVAPTIYRRAKS